TYGKRHELISELSSDNGIEAAAD
ncbi:MAG: hypothetical protein RL228_1168, partial [Actinomycetota bacterium]